MGHEQSPQTEQHGSRKEVVAGEAVRIAELDAIVARRQVEFGESQEKKFVEKNLVGLALSGGGIRSGAICLGLLNALKDNRLLRFVDYLSTVSGGGYAGAHLSSSALAGRKPKDEAEKSIENANRENETKKASPGSADSALGDRMLKFIHGGTYLRLNGSFCNRYLIGLLLVWTVLLSGLLFFTSGTALLFRCLDFPSCRVVIYALGFDDEVKLAFFPSFVLLIAWILAWAISYWREGPRSSGVVARYLYYGLIAVTLIAIATLIGNGEITSRSSAGVSNSKQTTEFSRMIGNVVIVTLIASLLPYLSPKRLFQSSKAPKNVVEKYTYWIATRALMIGVPLALVGYFAHENISGWNERRDDRLAWTEISDWNPDNPLWQHLLVSAETNSDRDAKPKHPRYGDLWNTSAGSPLTSVSSVSKTNQKDKAQELRKTDFQTGFQRTWARFREAARIFWEQVEARSLVDRQKDKMEELLRGYFYLSQQRRKSEKDPDNLIVIDQANQDTRKVLQEKPEDIFLPYHQAAEARTSSDAEYYFWEQSGHVFTWLFTFDESAANRNSFVTNVTTRYKMRQLKAAIAHQINLRLEDPWLYARIFPDVERMGNQNKQANKSDRGRRIEPSHQSKAFRAVMHWHQDFMPASTDDSRQEGWLAKIRGLCAEASVLAHLDQEVWGTGEAGEAATKSTERAQNRLDGNTYSPPSEGPAEARRLAIIEVNRKLLRAYFGDLIDDKGKVYSTVVLYEDQVTRLWWFLGTLAVFLIAGFVMDLNSTSLHGFYSKQLGEAWIEPLPTFGRDIPLVHLRTTEVGMPYHLIDGSVQFFGGADKAGHKRFLTREGFLFSQLYCGSKSLGFVHTDQFMNASYELDDAIAVSGAAVSPVQSSNPLQLMLLMFANMRLGQWVETPGHYAKRGYLHPWTKHWRFTPFQALLACRKPIRERSLCFVTDGGHYENLGIEPLLQRRCRLIFAMDAGQDQDYAFADFTTLMRRMRIMEGIKFELLDDGQSANTFEQLIPAQLRYKQAGADRPTVQGKRKEARAEKGADEENLLEKHWSECHFVMLRIIYDQDQPDLDGCLIYMKPTLTGDEPFDLQQYARLNSSFPHDQTADQFFAPDRFESYRQLGYHIMNTVCDQFGERIREAVSQHDLSRLMSFLGQKENVSPTPEQESKPLNPKVDPEAAESCRKELERIRELLLTNDVEAEEEACRALKALGRDILQAMPQVLSILSLKRMPLFVMKHAYYILFGQSDHAVREICHAVDTIDEKQGLLTAIELLSELGRFGDDVDSERIIQTHINIIEHSSQGSARVLAAALEVLYEQGPHHEGVLRLVDKLQDHKSPRVQKVLRKFREQKSDGSV
ncbi:MAG: hypothetical protein MI725_13765 [Pirellulales bacterium]|nr:hypothetical protein [Pirellulales bacterium]